MRKKNVIECYKVVRKVDEKLYSANPRPHSYKKAKREGILLSYRIGHWRYPLKDCGPLCAFQTEEYARRWTCDKTDLHIYKCQAVRSKKRLLRKRSGAGLKATLREAMYYYIFGSEGAILCDCIKLIERVD